MRKRLWTLLLVGLFSVGSVGCSQTARGFVAGAVVGAAVVAVCSSDHGQHPKPCKRHHHHHHHQHHGRR